MLARLFCGLEYSVDSIKRTVLLNVLLPKKIRLYLTYHILENLKADKFCDFKNLLCLDLKILLCLDFSILLCLDFKKSLLNVPYA